MEREQEVIKSQNKRKKESANKTTKLHYFHFSAQLS